MSKQINQAAVTVSVKGALRAATAYSERVTELQALLGGRERAAVVASLQPAVAAFYDIKIVDGQRGAGFDQTHTSYEAARKALLRLTRDVLGTSADRTETRVRVKASERAAFEAFVAACGDSKRARVVFKALIAG